MDENVHAGCSILYFSRISQFLLPNLATILPTQQCASLLLLHSTQSNSPHKMPTRNVNILGILQRMKAISVVQKTNHFAELTTLVGNTEFAANAGNKKRQQRQQKKNM